MSTASPVQRTGASASTSDTSSPASSSSPSPAALARTAAAAAGPRTGRVLTYDERGAVDKSGAMMSSTRAASPDASRAAPARRAHAATMASSSSSGSARLPQQQHAPPGAFLARSHSSDGSTTPALLQNSSASSLSAYSSAASELQPPPLVRSRSHGMTATSFLSSSSPPTSSSPRLGAAALAHDLGIGTSAAAAAVAPLPASTTSRFHAALAQANSRTAAAHAASRPSAASRSRVASAASVSRDRLPRTTTTRALTLQQQERPSDDDSPPPRASTTIDNGDDDDDDDDEDEDEDEDEEEPSHELATTESPRQRAMSFKAAANGDDLLSASPSGAKSFDALQRMFAAAAAAAAAGDGAGLEASHERQEEAGEMRMAREEAEDGMDDTIVLTDEPESISASPQMDRLRLALDDDEDGADDYAAAATMRAPPPPQQRRVPPSSSAERLTPSSSSATLAAQGTTLLSPGFGDMTFDSDASFDFLSMAPSSQRRQELTARKSSQGKQDASRTFPAPLLLNRDRPFGSPLPPGGGTLGTRKASSSSIASSSSRWTRAHANEDEDETPAVPPNRLKYRHSPSSSLTQEPPGRVFSHSSRPSNSSSAANPSPMLGAAGSFSSSSGHGRNNSSSAATAPQQQHAGVSYGFAHNVEHPITPQALLLDVLSMRSAASAPMTLSQSHGPASRSVTPPASSQSALHQRMRSIDVSSPVDGPQQDQPQRADNSAGLAKLEVVDLSHKRIAALPPEVVNELRGECEKLALAYNILRDLPPQFSALGSTLRYLNIHGNMLTQFPMVLCDLPSLTILDISKNKIKILPSSPGRLLNLRVFSLSKNRVRRLPPWLTEMSHLRTLKVDHNPLEWPPREVATFTDDGRNRVRADDSDEMQRWLAGLLQWMRDDLRRNADSSDDDEAARARLVENARHSRNASLSTVQTVGTGFGLRSKKSLPDLRQPHADIIAERLADENEATAPTPRRKESEPPPRAATPPRSRQMNLLAKLGVMRSPQASTKPEPPPQPPTQPPAQGLAAPRAAGIERQPSDYGRHSGAYFRRLSMLPPSTVSKTIPVTLLEFADAVRGILFALSQLVSALRQFIDYASHELLPASVPRVLNKADETMGNLINALDRFDSVSRRGAPEPGVVQAMFERCRDAVSTASKLVDIVGSQLQALTATADIRFTRTLALLLYGSVGEIASSWNAVAPLLQEMSQLNEDSSLATLILQPSTPSPTKPEAPSPAPPLQTDGGASEQGQSLLARARSRTRRNAGSFSVEDVQMGAAIPPAPMPPLPAAPPPSLVGGPLKLELPPRANGGWQDARSGDPTPTPGSLHFALPSPGALPMLTPTPMGHHNNAHMPSSLEAAADRRTGKTTTTAASADEAFVELAETTAAIAREVYRQLMDRLSRSKQSASSTSSSGLEDGGDGDVNALRQLSPKRLRELSDLCQSGNESTARMLASLARVKAPGGGDSRTAPPSSLGKFTASDARRLGDDSYAFVRTVIAFAKLIKLISVEHGLSNRVREGVGTLTVATREFAKHLTHSSTSFRPVVATGGSAAGPAPNADAHTTPVEIP